MGICTTFYRYDYKTLTFLYSTVAAFQTQFIPILTRSYKIISIKAKPTSGLLSSAVFSEVSVTRNAKTVPFNCLLAWHEQVYLKIFSIAAAAFANT